MAAYGFRIARHLSGGTPRAWEKTIASGYNTSIYAGDAVTLAADGTLTRAAAGGVICGVFDGVLYTTGTNEVVFSANWPANTVASNIKAFFYNDPKIVWRCWDDADSGFLTAADVGTSMDLIVGTANTAYGYSGMMLDTSTKSATSSQFKLIGKVDMPGNDWATANGDQVEVEVMINEHFFELAAGI